MALNPVVPITRDHLDMTVEASDARDHPGFLVKFAQRRFLERFADLDQATCRLAMKNGRFQAARDEAGNAVTSRITLPSVRWRIEK